MTMGVSRPAVAGAQKAQKEELDFDGFLDFLGLFALSHLRRRVSGLGWNDERTRHSPFHS
jgi:hypothetical protein